MSQGLTPLCESSTIFFLIVSGSGLPLTNNPPSWLTPPWPLDPLTITVKKNNKQDSNIMACTTYGRSNKRAHSLGLVGENGYKWCVAVPQVIWWKNAGSVAPDEALRCLHARTVQFATDQLVTVNLLRSGYLHGLSIEWVNMNKAWKLSTYTAARCFS